MASFFDLAPRLAALQSAGLLVASDYKGAPAQWLLSALDGVDVRAINCKGIKPDDVPVMIRLSALEAMLCELDELRILSILRGEMGDVEGAVSL